MSKPVFTDNRWRHNKYKPQYGPRAAFHGFKLRRAWPFDIDVDLECMDAPEHLPAGCCKSYEMKSSILDRDPVYITRPVTTERG